MIRSISVVIPARDEELYLPTCLASLRSAADHAEVNLEIVVVINRCTDKTESIARKANCKIVYSDARNLSIIRNVGVRATTHPFICTVDADNLVSKSMFVEVNRALDDKTIVGGGVLIWPERWSAGILLTFVCLLPIAFLNGISGGLFYFRRDDFEQIGGFNEEWVSAEDIEFAKRLKAYGKQTNRHFKTLWKASITTSCRKFDRLGDWFFLKNPFMAKELLFGKNQAAADKVWYTIERKDGDRG